MAEGWIKLHRSFLEHWLCDEYRPLTKREAWETMLFTVNYESKKCLIKGQLYDCDRGQSLLSLQNWADKFVWSVQNVRSFFKLLESDNMIITEGLQYTTRLTICNYDKYQDKQQTANTPPTDQQQTANTPLTTTKEREEIKKEKEINISFENFWDLYEKKVGDKVKIEKKWNSLTNEERIRIMEYIPKYKQSQPDKKYRKNPDTFFNQKSWNDEIIASTQVKFKLNNSSYE